MASATDLLLIVASPIRYPSDLIAANNLLIPGSKSTCPVYLTCKVFLIWTALDKRVCVSVAPRASVIKCDRRFFDPPPNRFRTFSIDTCIPNCAKDSDVADKAANWLSTNIPSRSKNTALILITIKLFRAKYSLSWCLSGTFD